MSTRMEPEVQGYMGELMARMVIRESPQEWWRKKLVDFDNRHEPYFIFIFMSELYFLPMVRLEPITSNPSNYIGISFFHFTNIYIILSKLRRDCWNHNFVAIVFAILIYSSTIIFWWEDKPIFFQHYLFLGWNMAY